MTGKDNARSSYTSATKETAASRLSRINSSNATTKKSSSSRRSSNNNSVNPIVPALAARSYHLPGYTWKQDWWQYFANNHPVLGICCCSRLHPVGFGKRIVVLIGSIASGLAITNLIYLYYLQTDGGLESEFASFKFNITTDAAAPATSSLAVTEVTFTKYQVSLWTVGTTIHSLFDLTVWYIVACGCCLPGEKLECLRSLQFMGNYIVIFAVVIVTATASLIVVLRATLEEQHFTGNATAISTTFGTINATTINDNNATTEEVLTSSNYLNFSGGGLFPDTEEIHHFDFTVKPEAYRFLISWCIELALALFVFYFLWGTILFSGILGCGGSLPVLGGRPRELKLEAKLEAKRQRKQGQARKSSSGNGNIGINVV